MRLDELTAGLATTATGYSGAGGDVEITGLAYDSSPARTARLSYASPVISTSPPAPESPVAVVARPAVNSSSRMG